MSFEKAIGLWHHYNTRLLRLHRRFAFPLLNFSVGADEYVDSVAKLAHALHLDAEAARKEPFFEEALRSAGANLRSAPYFPSISAVVTSATTK